MTDEAVAKDYGEGWYQGLRAFMATVEPTEEEIAQSKLLILEYEAGRLLGSAAKILERIDRLKPPRNTPMDVRRRLLRAYVRIENQDKVECDEYEEAVDNFLALTKGHVDEIGSVTLKQAYGFIELEANVMAAVQAFFFTLDGKPETDSEEGRKRFRDSVMRRIMTLQREEEDQYSSEKTARLKFLKITKSLDDVQHFCEEFPRNHFLDCCKQLTIEIQERLFGPPRLSAHLIDASAIETLAIQNKVNNFPALSMKGFAIPPTPARQLIQATKELREAVGPSASKPKRPRAESAESDDREHKVATRSTPQTSKSPTAVPRSVSKAAVAPRTPQAAPVASNQPASAQNAPGSANKTPNRKVVFDPATQDESQQASQTQAMSESDSKSPRRSMGKRIKFSKEEDEIIQKAVEKHGEGRWSIILNDPEFGPKLRQNGRTNVSIKDRWRNTLGSKSHEGIA